MCVETQRYRETCQISIETSLRTDMRADINYGNQRLTGKVVNQTSKLVWINAHASFRWHQCKFAFFCDVSPSAHFLGFSAPALANLQPTMDETESHNYMLSPLIFKQGVEGVLRDPDSAEIERVIREYRENPGVIREFCIGCDAGFSLSVVRDS